MCICAIGEESFPSAAMLGGRSRSEERQPYICSHEERDRSLRSRNQLKR